MSNKNPLKWDQRFMQMAQLVSTWSLDPSTKVGSVIVDQDKHVVSVGFNGFAKGIADDNRLLDRETKYKLIIHAEENAFIHAHGSLKGTTLYCYPFLPCASCASKIIQCGITRIVATDDCPARWKDSFELSMSLFIEAGVDVLLFDRNDKIFGVDSFVCQTTWEFELGQDADGTTLYPSTESYAKQCKCCAGDEFPAKLRTFRIN